MMVPNILYGAERGVICTDGTGLDCTDLVPWCHAVSVKEGRGESEGGLKKRTQLLVVLILSLVTIDMAPESFRIVVMCAIFKVGNMCMKYIEEALSCDQKCYRNR